MSLANTGEYTINHKVTLVLGGTRSGKSVYAENLAIASHRRRIYLATAQALDEEMHGRIQLHQARRGTDWVTREIPHAIAEAIADPQYADSVLLVDCLTLWLSNLMHQQLDIAHHTQGLIDALQQTQATVILVSSEVGQGIVPDNKLARQFSDAAGIMNQQIAAVADRVVWMVAGIPTVIKGA